MGCGPKYKCKNCGDIVQSKWEGHFASCSCFNTSQVSAEEIVERFKFYKAERGEEADLNSPDNHLWRCAISDIIYRGFFVDSTEHYTRAGGNFRDMIEIKDDNTDDE